MVRTISKAARGVQEILRPATLIVALALTGGYATDASAACPGSGMPNAGPFFIDGIVGDTVSVNGLDAWCNNSGVSPGATKVTDPFGNVKELGPANQTNTKVNPINGAPTPMLDFTNPNGQVDLTAIYTQSAVLNQHLWFYFGWARDANSGSGFIAIELERSGVPTGCVYDATGIDMVLPQTAAETTLINSCNPWKGRAGDGTPQHSDLMILWDQSGGSKDMYVRYFDSAAGKFGVATPLDATITAAAYSSDGFRGEAGVDLTAIVNSGQATCLTFANIIPGTVTGNSDTADYKDTVLAKFPFASSCGTVAIKKLTKDPNGNLVTNLTGTFIYTLNRAASANMRYSFTAPNPCNLPDCAESLTTTTRKFTNGGQSATYQDLIAAGDYRLTEDESALESVWALTSITCAVGNDYPTQLSSTKTNPLTTITVSAGATTYCVILNQRSKTTPTEATTPSAKVFLFDSVVITVVDSSDRPSQVTFGLYDNSTCTVDANAGKHQIGSNVLADITYTNSNTTASASTLNTVGHNGIQVLGQNGNVYYWKMSYPGDTFNNAFVTCGTGAIGDLEHTAVTITHGIN